MRSSTTCWNATSIGNPTSRPSRRRRIGLIAKIEDKMRGENRAPELDRSRQQSPVHDQTNLRHSTEMSTMRRRSRSTWVNPHACDLSPNSLRCKGPFQG